MPYRGLVSQTFDSRVTEFISANGRIVVDYSANPSTSSHYEMDGSSPVITIVDRDVVLTAQRTGVSYDQAYAEILVHELGHFVNSGIDSIRGALVSSLSDAKAFIFNREAEAAIFGAVVTSEVRENGGDFRVAGTSAINDLFTRVNDAVTKALDSGAVDVFGATVQNVSNYWAADPAYRAYADAQASSVLAASDRFVATPHFEAQLPDSLFDYTGGGCVQVESLLPGGSCAGGVVVGDELALADEETLEASTGVVSYSVRKSAIGFRIATESGAELVCSDSAPIPVRGGRLLRPAGLGGQEVAVRDDTVSPGSVRWERIVRVQLLGSIEVQHITVGNRSFWAGAKEGLYILHHNVKDAGGGAYPYNPDFDGWFLTAGAGANLNSVAPSGQFDEFGRPRIGLVGMHDS